MANEYGLKVHRGSSENVLERYAQALDRFPSDYVVRVTADNPLTSIEMFDDAIEQIVEQNYDYIHAPSLPLGSAVDVFKSQALHDSNTQATSAYQREHINAFILDNHEKFSIGTLEVPKTLQRPEVRLTIDTIQDLNCVKKIVNAVDDPTRVTLQEIIQIYDSQTFPSDVLSKAMS